MLKIRRRTTVLSLTQESYTWERRSLYWDGTQYLWSPLSPLVIVHYYGPAACNVWYLQRYSTLPLTALVGTSPFIFPRNVASLRFTRWWIEDKLILVCVTGMHHAKQLSIPRWHECMWKKFPFPFMFITRGSLDSGPDILDSMAHQTCLDICV